MNLERFMKKTTYNFRIFLQISFLSYKFICNISI